MSIGQKHHFSKKNVITVEIKLYTAGVAYYEMF